MAADIRLKESSLPSITDRIVATYVECGGIHHLDHCPLPSREVIIRMIDDLHEVLYPGFSRRQNLHLSNVEYHTGALLVTLHDSLTEQISRALKHDCEAHGTPLIDYEQIGQRKAVQFLETLPDLRRTLADDAQSAVDGDPAAADTTEVVFCYPGLLAITIYRLAHELHKLDIPLIPRMMTEYAHSKTGIDIHPGARIGKRFFIDHGTGVVIGETCDIGQDVKLYQGVTLGALSFPKDDAGNIIKGQKRHPTLKDGVVVYANATILGGDTVVGENTVIGSSVWITSSVAPNMVVTLEKPNLRIKGTGLPGPSSRTA
ncbi:serine acetyltransferase [bacterium]|nr:serine acetyltransferase [bacterium]